MEGQRDVIDFLGRSQWSGLPTMPWFFYFISSFLPPPQSIANQLVSTLPTVDPTVELDSFAAQQDRRAGRLEGRENEPCVPGRIAERHTGGNVMLRM